MKVWGALRAAALLSSLWAAPLRAAKDGPTFKDNTFKHYPQSLSYFEDSDVILFQDVSDSNVYRSADAGVSWDRVTEVPEGKTYMLVMHEYNHDRAYILTQGILHYRTEDKGNTWTSFMTDAEVSIFRGEILNFHADDPDRIIFNGMDCQGIFCEEVAMYTTDGFKSDAKFLRGNTGGCWWAKSSHLFTTGQDDLDKQRILCIVRDSFSPLKQDQRLLISDNFFNAKSADGVIQEFEPNLDVDRPVQGIVNLAIVKKYLLVAATSLNTDEMALFVTDDTLKWHRAMFPTDHRVNQEAYTVLESTNYSIQIDVMTTRPSNPMGVMFTSNSNGTYFTRNIEHTNRNHMGHVDFEKISGIQGIFLVNKVDNWEDVQNDALADKKIITEITHDDGRTFAPITVGKDKVHLHSVTDLSNVGRVFSSPAPGLVMGNGNTGDFLKAYRDSSLFVSDDAGMTWTKALDGPHKYEFGDQGSILVAIHDSEKDDVGEVKYSLDHGLSWKSAELPDGLKIKPWIITTTQDSTSLKFVLVGQTGDEFSPTYHVISLDFEGLHEKTCGKDDMETWWARVDEKGEPTCLMGHTQKYERRKKTAECFLKSNFVDPVVETTNCDCSDQDFECDYNFRREGDSCAPSGPIPAPEEACKNAKPDDTFMGSSGWRLIPGNTCNKKKGEKYKDEPVERKCSDSESAPKAPASGEIKHSQYVFKGDWDGVEKHYLETGESSSTSSEETIIARALRGNSKASEIVITKDHGETWEHPKGLDDDKVWAILPHRYFKDVVFFLGREGDVTYTVNRGDSFEDFKAPNPPARDIGTSPLAFHPDHKDWLIWVGEKCHGDDCFLEASFSRDRGDHWTTIQRYVQRCEFVGSSAYKYRDDNQILCLARKREDSEPNNPWQLVGSTDFFETKEVYEDEVKDFATMAEFIVVATENPEKESLRALASLDGRNYAEARFPYNFEVSHQSAYTVLDSSTHAVNLFVVTETKEDHHYGTIIKSNYNGTSYVLSISGVNADNSFYVDFEKMLGIEGIILVNVVANRDKKKESKKLRTMISHNDGAEWAYLPPPEKDADDKAFSCKTNNGKGTEKCALHIHGYTEREDHRKTYSSEGAIGLMLGVGNVGEYLGDYKDADTFMTTDAGITWKNVKKGKWIWSFGDQGSIVVLVQRHTKTKIVSYTTDEGHTWKDYPFSEKEVIVNDITSLRSGASRKFVVWGEDDGEQFATTIDFEGMADRPCTHDQAHLEESDYYLWSPKHPMQDNDCLFGHVSQYLRKKTSKECYNGYRMQHLYNIQNCTCSRRDFECDYNYELDNHQQCKLVEGLRPVDPMGWCKENPDAVEYFEPTGYRRIPLTTCAGGLEMDKQSDPHPCPGHRDEFDQRHRLSGVGLFFAIAVPFAVAGAVGWYVWRNWDGKFGQIRLGDSGGHTGTGMLDSDKPWVRYPIIAISALAAVAASVPLVASAIWRTVKGWTGGSGGGGGWSRLGRGGARPFTTRDSFARGRGDYAIVDDDEGELLGDDSDEEV
ncbi:Sortilin [Pleurostoma richardsiae]|uniref:Vacuolar protein sorting/targeting protein 10 n=1 Tax=Pleurostoma richardsiae TaxID=41990 RepID=A0AA38RV74_9PEZI|nr:Sortilin [Pleurostoma richardsiae]